MRRDIPTTASMGMGTNIRKNIAMIFNHSRGACVPDTYLDGYCGTIISDGYPVYKRFDPGGRHQICIVDEVMARI